METKTKIKYDFYENQTLLGQTRKKLNLIKEEILPYYGDMRLTEIVQCLEEQETKFSKNIDAIFDRLADPLDGIISPGVTDKRMDAEVGDIIYHDGKSLKFTNPVKWNASLGTPVAVVVIPASHMADKKCRGMSLCNMSYVTPQTGTLGTGKDNASTNGTNLMWGVYGTDVDGLTNYTTVKTTGETNSYGYLPSDLYKGMTQITIIGDGTYAMTTQDSVDDTEAAWWRTISSEDFEDVSDSELVISPYAADGSQNPVYITAGQALADMDGKANTEALVTKSAIKDTYSSGSFENVQANYPAAFACSLFSTSGTSKGDWYLPALGELGYLYTRVKKINESLGVLGTSAVQFGDFTKDGSSLGVWCWSSSEYNAYNAWYLINPGYVYNCYKANDNVDIRVRAFAAFDF